MQIEPHDLPNEQDSSESGKTRNLRDLEGVHQSHAIACVRDARGSDNRQSGMEIDRDAVVDQRAACVEHRQVRTQSIGQVICEKCLVGGPD